MISQCLYDFADPDDEPKDGNPCDQPLFEEKNLLYIL